ncbi:MAG: xanthine dehydrogenase family protein subunit M [Hyphomicrobiales bacterium]|nr:xanthine dehydrogenase family protein subunit M [Hyphomicrobiales bacterium]
MYNFDYVRPSSVSDAAQALSNNTDASLVAGGHTLIPTLKQRLAQPSALIDISQLAELKGIRSDGGNIVIGAATTHAEVAGSADVKAAIPALAELANGIGDRQVRHRGTIGGSVANNDPSADYPAALLGLGASVVTNRGRYDADSFFTGLFSTALHPGEIITAVHFPIPDKAGYAKFEQRASRYCLVSVFVAQKSGGIFSSGETRVAVSGAGQNGVFRVAEMEQALQGNFSPSGVSGIKVSSANLMNDMHGAADYRAALITAMAERAVGAASA